MDFYEVLDDVDRGPRETTWWRSLGCAGWGAQVSGVEWHGDSDHASL